MQAAVPEVIHRGTRLKSGMIGRLGTGSFLWPVPGYSGISRWASLPYGHRGVDITAPYGTPIYAADAGTVIAAQWHNHPTMSWGYYVEIDHGNGYKTLYAHMSSFVVQAGQTGGKGAADRLCGGHRQLPRVPTAILRCTITMHLSVRGMCSRICEVQGRRARRVVDLIYFANRFTFCFPYGKILCIVKLTKLSFRCNGAHERELFA